MMSDMKSPGFLKYLMKLAEEVYFGGVKPLNRYDKETCNVYNDAECRTLSPSGPSSVSNSCSVSVDLMVSVVAVLIRSVFV